MGHHGRNQHGQRLERMKKEPHDVVVVSSKPVGPSVIFWPVGVFVVVPDMGREKHETRHALNNTEHPICKPIQHLGFPYTQMRVMVLSHAKANRENKHQEKQQGVKAIEPLIGHQQRIDDEVGQGLEVPCSMKENQFSSPSDALIFSK